MRISNKKTGLAFLLLLYLCVLLRITVFRSSFSLTGLFAGGSLQWVPFYNLYLAFTNQGLFYFLYLFLGNIIWFVPLGFLLPALSGVGLRLPKLLLAGFCLSFLIELLQYIFGTGVSEVDDLLLNTLGTAAGYFLYRLMARLKNAVDILFPGNRFFQLSNCASRKPSDRFPSAALAAPAGKILFTNHRKCIIIKGSAGKWQFISVALGIQGATGIW